jgi:hypothetical protein
MYHNSNDLGGGLAEAFDANLSYYVLGYYLENENSNRQFRRIAIKVKNHPEYVIRAPKGYYSDPPRANPAEGELTPVQQLGKALLEPLPRTAIGVSATADYMEADDDELQVTLTTRIEGDNLQYREENGRHTTELAVVTRIYDSSGKQVHAFDDRVLGNLTPERLILARLNGYRISRRLALKPGIYQARIGVREIATDRIGTANAWVEVPNLARSRFALSSLVLIDAPDAGNVAEPADTSAAIGWSRVVQGVRLFPPNRSCVYFFRIQKGGKATAEPALEYQVELIRSGKPIVQGDWWPVPSVEQDGKGISLNGKINLAGMSPGIYELRVTLKDSRSKQSAQRTTLFGIGP